MSQNGPLITSAETIRTMRQQKYNPLRNLTPAVLARVLEQFEIGYLREAAMLFEVIADRDDTIKSVKPKREKEVSQLDKQVLALPETGPAGDAHREILEDFWNNVQAVNAYDRNERGGFRRLVKQMMSSISYRYACHHIVWRPSHGKLRATFEFVPLWLFENRSGSLRYLRDPFGQSGEILADGEWMVTQGDGLMIACSIGYLAKRSAFNDWLIFSEKFSVPGVLGRTSAKKGSPEADAMRAAVESFGHDWTGVLYGDDGAHQKPIEIIQAAGNPSGMPMPAVVERVDRKFAALYRGADLSTMSAGGGEGTGASLQGKEKEILLADDAETINETLAAVSKQVIEWHFGRGTEPLAIVQLMVPSDEDEKFYLESVKVVKDMGVRLSKDAVLERLGLQEADETEVALGETQDLKTQDARPEEEAPPAEQIINSAAGDVDAMQAIRTALAADLQPLGDALFSAYQSGDAAAMTAALRKISTNMPELAGNASALSDELTGQMVDAFLGEDSEDVANAERGKPVGYFFAGGSRRPIYASKSGTPLSPKGQSQPLSVSKQAGSIQAALAAASRLEQGASFSMGRIEDGLAKRILEMTDAHGDPRDVMGAEWRIDSDFVAHARRFHPNLTDEDFLQIPGIIAKAPIILPGTNDRGLPTINFRMKRSQREYLLVSVQFNKQGQLALNTFKKSAEGKTL